MLYTNDLHKPFFPVFWILDLILKSDPCLHVFVKPREMASQGRIQLLVDGIGRVQHDGAIQVSFLSFSDCTVAGRSAEAGGLGRLVWEASINLQNMIGGIFHILRHPAEQNSEDATSK